MLRVSVWLVLGLGLGTKRNGVLKRRDGKRERERESSSLLYLRGIGGRGEFCSKVGLYPVSYV